MNFFTTDDRLDYLMYAVRDRAISKSPGLPRKEHQRHLSAEAKNFRIILATEPISRKDVYSIRELTVFDDVEFIDNAYRAVLRRAADLSGKAAYLSRLRNGQLSKVGILGRLRFSVEGRKKPVRVRGLMFPFVLELTGKVPIIGPFIQLLTNVLLSPWIISDLKRQVARMAARQTLLMECLSADGGDISIKQTDCKKEEDFNLDRSVSDTSHPAHPDNISPGNL